MSRKLFSLAWFVFLTLIVVFVMLIVVFVTLIVVFVTFIVVFRDHFVRYGLWLVLPHALRALHSDLAIGDGDIQHPHGAAMGDSFLQHNFMALFWISRSTIFRL